MLLLFKSVGCLLPPIEPSGAALSLAAFTPQKMLKLGVDEIISKQHHISRAAFLGGTTYSQARLQVFATGFRALQTQAAFTIR